jgi:hypothetical protein
MVSGAEEIMRRLLLLIVCCVCLWGLASCQNGGSGTAGVSDAGDLPDYMVGIWYEDNYRWAFKVEKDGSISQLSHTIGVMIDVGKGEFVQEAPDGNIAYYALGPCELEYDPDTRRLDLKIILEYFRMELPDGVLEGTSTDVFNGEVSKDGSTWIVDWRSYSHIEGAARPDPNLIDENPDRLIFVKVPED